MATNDEAGEAAEEREPSLAQRLLDNLWFLLALGVVIPAVLYLGWGLWEFAELPQWGGQ